MCQPLAISPLKGPSAALAASVCMGWGSNALPDATISSAVTTTGGLCHRSPTWKSSKSRVVEACMRAVS